ncbi:GIL1 family protein [Magnetospirillum aberrantis]|uniref:GIL1 family protein n=1 Tax=Magnetospirillum aberrantis SpK TaxID=908842 RepID=A0A7C9V1L6_9PROT|nr:GIL1 family protein [Magnetospirillum aberrantis]NFV82114.1 GIL1 family protein [Magnetospirillum aberrantis SpK]
MRSPQASGDMAFSGCFANQRKGRTRMPLNPKIQAATEEKVRLEKSLDTLRIALDDAADANKPNDVKRLQAEIAATREMIASYGRRIEKLHAQDSEVERQARRKANDEALAQFKRLSSKLPGRAVEIRHAVAALAAQIAAFQTIADQCGDLAYSLTQQIDERRFYSSVFLHLPIYVRFTDGVLGHCVADELRKARIFREFAVNPHVDLPRLDLSPIEECIEARVEKLTVYMTDACKYANEGIQP